MFTLWFFFFFLKNREFEKIKETLIFFFLNFKFQNQLERSQDIPSGGPSMYGVHLIK